MCFFIKNLYHEIVELHKTKKQISKLKLYRGKIILNEYFQEIQNNLGGLLSLTSFISTSERKDVASTFTRWISNREKSVLFEITIDPTSHSSVPYANIVDFSNFGLAEKEYLFSMSSVFRIGNINADDNGIYHVHLSLTSENDEQLTDLTKYMRKHYMSSPSRLCDIANNHNKESNPNQETIALVENNIGMVYFEQNKYSQTFKHYVKSLKIRLRNLIHIHPDIAQSLNNIGMIYAQQEKYEYALFLYILALEIKKKNNVS
ncbi:unnamed protein product [Rotaria sp. Silwood2]|nr:unnamed protein product [Rotaria sp. Silwood2]CAF4628901.1 unnamed protein product [Rotaria sp. Silwood2]